MFVKHKKEQKHIYFSIKKAFWAAALSSSATGLHEIIYIFFLVQAKYKSQGHAQFVIAIVWQNSPCQASCLLYIVYMKKTH